MTTNSYDYEVVVIGSGFGGGILACRTSKAWPGKVLVLERGKRYPMGSFPRTPHDMARNFWYRPDEDRARPDLASEEELHGMFDIRNFRNMDAVVCAGYGGGSLIYANVYMQPPDEVFAQGWPKSINRASLEPYYRITKAVLGARPIPPENGDLRRKVVRAELFKEVAQKEGRNSQLCDINVFFGNDFDNPTPIGVQEKNRHGALQTSCVYCGECDVGCNTHSKNTVDLNYLFAAEHRYGARILTEHLAERIVPLNAAGQDDPGADGSDGYRVYYRDLNNKKEISVSARRVVVSAGTLGSNELLLRCRDVFRTLPRISDNLGRRFSGNGDFLSFVFGGKRAADPNYGPVITQATDFNLFSNFDRSRAFVLEDASYPAFGSWFIEALPSFSHLSAFWKTLKDTVRRLFSGASFGRIGFALGDLLSEDLSYNASVLLCMGLDNANGVARLNANGYLDVDWPRRANMPLYNAILDSGRRFRDQVGAKTFFAMPNWWWPSRKNITVHALGGCRLADSPAEGVTSAKPEEMGQVFGYKGLYVADGSIVPTALGANPIATISALSERVAEGMTGVKPGADL